MISHLVLRYWWPYRVQRITAYPLRMPKFWASRSTRTRLATAKFAQSPSLMSGRWQRAQLRRWRHRRRHRSMMRWNRERRERVQPSLSCIRCFFKINLARILNMVKLVINKFHWNSHSQKKQASRPILVRGLQQDLTEYFFHVIVKVSVA